MSEERGQVILVEDDADMRQAVSRWLRLSGFKVQACDNGETALAVADPAGAAVVVSDVRMLGLDGLALLERLREVDADLPVILITGHGDIDMAVQAIRRGAYDFIEKPCEPERLCDSVARALEKRRLVLENRALRRRVRMDDAGSPRLVGSSAPMARLRRQIEEVADIDASVLLVGETGTGKEVAARCLHELGQRRGGPFVAVDCGAVPESMAESELFGHEAGAFTGARARRIGRMEYAAGGSLFLDEVVSMPTAIQGKLLRALQEREICRLGANRLVPLDFRLIAAMNVEPEAAVADGRLRSDLYYRFNTVEIRIPPLRERKADLPVLFAMFTQQAADTYDRECPDLDPAGRAALLAHDWPGNVRELRNVAVRYVLSSLPLGDRLAQLLEPGRAAATIPGSALADQVRDFERSLIKDSLKRHHGRVKDVMTELDLPRRTLNDKMQRYGLLRAEDDPAEA